MGSHPYWTIPNARSIRNWSMGTNAFDRVSTVGGSGKSSMGSSIMVESSPSERSEMSELLSKVRLHILAVLVSLPFDLNLRREGEGKVE